MRIIGLAGGMGVGKSTAVSVIKKEFNAELIKFAQPLYDIQEYVYQRIFSVYARKETFVKDRKLLQWIGTEWGRDTISQTLWVDIWKAAALRTLEDGYIVVCDDVRFDNEAETIRAMGGKIIEITSKYADARIDTDAGISKHASESGLSRNLIDKTVDNSDTLQAFQQAILDAVVSL